MRCRVAVTFACVVALAAPALAEDRRLAEQHFRLGEKAYQAQDFEAAAAQFEEAYKHFELPEIAFSAAQAYRRLYRIKPKPADVARAVELYRIYLAKVTTGGRVADAADALSEMQHELESLISAGAQVSPDLAKEHTRISINVSFGNDAEAPRRTTMQEVEELRAAPTTNVHATLDGQPVKTLTPINVLPGPHTIVVTADGFFTAQTKLEVSQGSSRIADVKLMPRPAKVTVITEGGARISVNGRLSGTAPLAPLELPAGKHVITLSMRGREPIARELAVGRGDELTLREPLRLTFRRKIVPWLVGGAGIATAVAGIGATFSYVRDSDAVDLLTRIRAEGGFYEADRRRYDRLRESRDRWLMTTYIGCGALAVLGGAAALLYYTDNPSPDGVRIEPVTLHAGGGAAIAGRF